MRAELTTNNRPDFIRANITNGDTVAIPTGTPVVLNLSSTPQPTTAEDGFAAGFQDGLQVVLPSTAGSPQSLFFAYGISMAQSLAVGAVGEALIFGIHAYALFVRATRASSTSSWSSSASLSSAAGFLLSIDTVNNAFASLAASSLVLSTVSSIVSTAGIDPQRQAMLMVLLDSLASFAASASNTSDSRTAMITQQRVFVRMM
jgi:hypothetical protein